MSGHHPLKTIGAVLASLLLLTLAESPQVLCRSYAGCGSGFRAA